MLQYRSRVLGLILLLMFAGTLLGPAQIQASPLTQTAPTGPQLLIPTWGASPGGVWHYTTTTATWTLKNNGLPGGKFWFWIAADPSNSARWLLLGNSVTNDYGTQYFQVDGGSVVMADGATTPLWLTQDAGQTWTAVALPATGSLTEKIRIRRVEWSETVNGQWMLAWGIDRIERDGYEVLTRGTVGSGSTSIILFGPDRGTGETSALPGANGEIVIH